MTPALTVYYGRIEVGQLSLSERGRMVFEYATAWKSAPDAFPISVSLPLTGGWTPGETDHRFFANLLPEADAREVVCRALGVSIENDFLLLERLGGECAGALSLYPDAKQPPEGGTYRRITEEELHTAVTTRLPMVRQMIEGAQRLSLAGGQSKWAVFVQDGQLFFPQGAVASSHILKFKNALFNGLPHNEAYVTFLASRLGLETMTVLPTADYSLTPRYDRFPTDQGLGRYHQEDFCQALGVAPRLKYQSEGGPDLRACAQLIRRHSTLPSADLQILIRWQILNLLLGNSDGHAKNISWLYKNGQRRLSPTYDLVCTRAYQGLSPNLGMSIGAQFDPGHVDRDDWHAMAEQLDVKPTLILRTLAELCQRLDQELSALTEEYEASYGKAPGVDRVRVLIKNQVRRTRTISL